MFGFSLASQLFQGSRERTWNCIARFTNLLWNKFNHFKHPDMPRSRKRHHSHSRSRSKSRSHSRDRSYERHKKIDGHDKDGKRRKLDPYDSPQHKRSVSCDRLPDKIEEIHQKEEDIAKNELSGEKNQVSEDASRNDEVKEAGHEEKEVTITEQADTNNVDTNVADKEVTTEDSSGAKNNNSDVSCSNSEQGDGQVGSSKMEVSDDETDQNMSVTVDDSDTAPGRNTPRNETTPKKHLTPKQLQRRLESEKKRQERQKERDEIKKKKQEEKDRLKQEKIKQKQEKEAERLKQLEEKQKEKEMKEEQRRKEKEEKEQKRKEKEEKEEQKRKEKEQEKLKRQQELEEKNKEKQREEEKKQKAAAAFVNFFVPKKSESEEKEKEKKLDDTCSIFMPFEVKSDMKLAPVRRNPLSELEKRNLENLIENPDNTASYLKELRGGKTVGKGFKTWPYEDPEDDIVVVEEGDLGETICENTKMKVRAKFLRFHENKRPPYFGTWRKKSKFVKPRRPFVEDKDTFNYEEDSDDDWEEEEQGESLNGSDDEADKENEEEKDDYEVDNEFFVPHGHLSDDEVDDEEKARLSPESLKQKLKLLKDEFEEDMKLKTHKLKPRFIGCVWYNKKGNNVDESINKYLQPFAMIFQNPVEIKKRSEIFNNSTSARKPKLMHELPVDQWPLFLKVVHGNVNNQKILVEQFITQMGNNGYTVDVSKSRLIKILKQAASWKKFKENGPYKNKFAWFVNEEIQQKYKVNLELPNSC